MNNVVLGKNTVVSQVELKAIVARAIRRGEIGFQPDRKTYDDVIRERHRESVRAMRARRRLEKASAMAVESNGEEMD